MIRMSKEADYGIVLLTHFAGGEGLTYSARALSDETRIPLPMVSKILKVLAREGVLSSRRGAKGGYSLALQPGRISVADIINVIEGPIAMTECVGTPGECKQEPVCCIRSNWQVINQAVLDALERISLQDMTSPLSDSLVPLEAGRGNEPVRPRAAV